MLEFWYQALSSEKGICISVDDGNVAKAKAQLYSSRKDACDPDLESISIVQSPSSPTELWLVRKTNGNPQNP